MKKELLTLLVALLLTFSAFSQNKFTLSGSVKDLSDGEDLIGLTISVKEMPATGTVSNVYGFYSLTLPQGEYTIHQVIFIHPNPASYYSFG